MQSKTDLYKYKYNKYKTKYIQLEGGGILNEAFILTKLDTLQSLITQYNKLTEFDVSALSDIPAAALREHAKQIFQKGVKALEDQSQDERDITSMTMAIDPELLPEASRSL